MQSLSLLSLLLQILRSHGHSSGVIVVATPVKVNAAAAEAGCPLHCHHCSFNIRCAAASVTAESVAAAAITLVSVVVTGAAADAVVNLVAAAPPA